MMVGYTVIHNKELKYNKFTNQTKQQRKQTSRQIRRTVKNQGVSSKKIVRRYTCQA